MKLTTCEPHAPKSIPVSAQLFSSSSSPSEPCKLAYQPFALRADPSRPKQQEAFRADLNVRLLCPDCQNENVQLVEEFGSGDLVCGECGALGAREGGGTS